MTFDELTPTQQLLLAEAEQAEDSALYLDTAAAADTDKVVVAEILAGAQP